MVSMTVQLFSVGMMHKETGEKIRLQVWAADVDEATNKIVDAIGGPDGQYSWTGSGPLYSSNEVIRKSIWG